MTALDGIDPGIRAWIADDARLQHELGFQEPSIDLAERRLRSIRLSDALAAEHSLPVADGCAIDELELPLPGGPALVRRYRPRDAAAALPTQLFLHGGGFAFGSARELVGDSLLSNRVVATGLQILSLEYRLAPEHPYPAARDQTIEAMRWLDEHAHDLQLDRDRLGLGGASAGASIAASAALLLGRDGHRPHHLALEVPAVSMAALETLTEDVGPAERSALELARNLYVHGDSADAFIADSKSIAELPSTLVMLAERDALRSGGELLVARMREAGLPVAFHLVLGHFHGTASVTVSSPAAQEWQELVDRELLLAYGSAARAA